MSLRTLGDETPISVGTGQIFDMKLNLLEAKDKPDAVFFNVRTLFRNFWEAFDKDTRPNVREMISDFMDELDTIGSLLLNMQIPYFYFWPQYNDLHKKLPGSKLKEKRGMNAILYETAEAVMAIPVTRRDDITMTDTLIPKYEGHVWLVSHHPVDLLSRYQFKSLTLLESHTGALKKPIVWNTKIFSNKDYYVLPFHPLTLCIFGDKSGDQLQGYPVKYRKVIMEMAEQNRWTVMTTTDKITNSINKIDDPEMKRLFKSMLHPKLK
jgi:hypothetical protein